MISNKIKSTKFRLFKIKNKVTVLLNKRNFTNNIAIISCNKFKNKVKEDLYLKHSLNKMNVNAEIVSWEDKSIDFKKYDALIIKSIWGYDNNLDEFNKWLNYIEKNNIKIFNSIEIIRNNFDKEKQFSILDKYNINHIETIFINKDDTTEIEKMLKKYNKIVIKPSISESGKNTYIINDLSIKNNIGLLHYW